MSKAKTKVPTFREKHGSTDYVEWSEARKAVLPNLKPCVFAPNSKYRVTVTPAKRDERKQCHTADEAGQTLAEKRASMAGFCSCKTGIHAIPGNNLGKTLEARLQY